MAGMASPITIQSVNLEEDYGIIVTFSDGTTAAYTVEELLELRPYRGQNPLKSAKPS
jgi:hypothetical protein